MGRYRSIPFGYSLRNGEMTICRKEAEIVERIFVDYIDGASYSEISKELSLKNVCYHEESTTWNKNMIKRILENKKYCGETGFPNIVTLEIFTEATNIRVGKQTSIPISRGVSKRKTPKIPHETNLTSSEFSIMRLEKQIMRALSEPISDSEYVRSLIFECAQEKFNIAFAQMHKNTVM